MGTDKKEVDQTNPEHYKQYPVEVIDMMLRVFGRDAVRDYCLLNAFKYRMRAGHKQDIELDLKKESWYLKKYQELGLP